MALILYDFGSCFVECMLNCRYVAFVISGQLNGVCYIYSLRSSLMTVSKTKTAVHIHFYETLLDTNTVYSFSQVSKFCPSLERP